MLLLRVQQLRVQGCAEVRGVEGLVLVKVGACEEAVEVGVAVIRDVESLGLEVAALRAKVRRVVLRQALAGLQEVLVKGGLLRELLRLRRSQELGAVEARRRDWEARGGVERGVVVGDVTEGVRRRGRRVPYMIIALTRRRGTVALFHHVVSNLRIGSWKVGELLRVRDTQALDQPREAWKVALPASSVQ